MWRYYLADNIQWAADRMPIQNFLSLLFSESTSAIEVLSVTIASPGRLVLEVRGECFDAPASLEYEIERKDFGVGDEEDVEQKRKLLDLIKLYYKSEQNRGMPTARKVAKAIKIDYK